MVAAGMLSILLGYVIYANHSRNELFENNIEALSDGESGLFYLGHHVEICGYAVITWNNLVTNCTNLKTVCDIVNHNDCQYSGCPIHG